MVIAKEGNKKRRTYRTKRIYGKAALRAKMFEVDFSGKKQYNSYDMTREDIAALPDGTTKLYLAANKLLEEMLLKKDTPAELNASVNVISANVNTLRVNQTLYEATNKSELVKRFLKN